MILRCEAQGCMAEAKKRLKFLDPRRDRDEQRAYVVKYACCDEHMLAICEELEEQSRHARLVY